uniref:Uncharacterized protein n=1 Tax=Anopheles maculatus TaxID=74869 RepID=A0A182T7E9_9DIPT
MRSGRRHQAGAGDYDPAGYSVIREGPKDARGPGPGPSGGSTLPKSFSMQQPRTTPMVSGRSASLLTMGHEYAEITKTSGKSKPIPPPISTIPSTREARARSKQQAASTMRAVSPSQYARTGPSGIAGSSAGNTSIEQRYPRQYQQKPEIDLKLSLGNQTNYVEKVFPPKMEQSYPAARPLDNRALGHNRCHFVKVRPSAVRDPENLLTV